MRKNEYKRYTMVGPGGLNCPCCGPQSGNKYAARARAQCKRQAKKRFNLVDTRLAVAELHGG